MSPTSGGTWISNNPGVATVTNAGVVNGVAAGTATFTFTSSTTNCSATTTAVTVNPSNTVTAASSTPTVCINTPITNITHTTTGATGIGTPLGLPAGVTAAWASNTITVSGTPTVAGVFNYTIPLTGGCGGIAATGTITVTANNTITLTSAVGTNAQTVCINTAITNITYSTTGATGATFAGLPAGVTGNWAANVVTISGSPTTTVGSPFSYTVTLTGGCGIVTATGTITVNPTPVGSASPQTICSGGTTSVTLNSTVPGTIYSYTAAIQTTPTGGSISGHGSGTANPIAQTLTNTGTTFGVIRYTVIPSYTNNGVTCAGTAFTVDVTVNPRPTGSASPQTICSGGTTNVTLNATTPAAGTTYSYTAAIQTAPAGGTITGQGSGTANPIAQTLINTGTTSAVIRYTVIPSYTNGGVTCTGQHSRLM